MLSLIHISSVSGAASVWVADSVRIADSVWVVTANLVDSIM